MADAERLIAGYIPAISMAVFAVAQNLTAPTSFGPRSVIGLRLMWRKSRNRLCGIRWNSDFDISPARIWRRPERPAKSCTSRCLG